MVAERSLDDDAGGHYHSEDDEHEADEGSEARGVKHPFRRRLRIDDFVHAGVAVLPDQEAGEIRNDGDEEHVERAGDNVENPISDGKRLVAIELRGIEGERRNAIAEGEQKNDDEDGALGDAPKMNAHGGAVFGEGRVVKADFGERLDRDGYSSIFGRFGAGLLFAFAEAEAVIGENENSKGDGDPKQTIPEHVSGVVGGECVFVGDSPVTGYVCVGADPEGVQDRADFLPLDVLQEAVRGYIRDEKANGADERSNFVTRQNGDGEENRRNDKGIGNGKNEDTIEVCFPDDGSPALGDNPRHELCEENTDGNAENRDEGDDRCTKETANQEIESAHGRGKYDLVGIEIEVSRSSGVDEGGGHQNSEEAHERVEVLNDKGCVAIGIGERIAERHVIGSSGEENHRGNDEEENPEHPGAEPVTEFEGKDLPEHLRVSSSRGFC